MVATLKDKEKNLQEFVSLYGKIIQETQAAMQQALRSDTQKEQAEQKSENKSSGVLVSS